MRKFFLFALVATTFAACATDETRDVVTVTTPETLTVSFEDADSRIQLQDGKTVWTAGDLVSVFYRSDANQKWQFQGATGDRTGTLKRIATMEATHELSNVVVVYPYNENYYINPKSCNIEASLPAEQTYLADSYGVGNNIMVSYGEYNQVVLKSVCGWLKVQLTGNGETVKNIKLKGNNGEQVAGQLYINSADATAVLASEMGKVEDDGSAGANLSFEDTVLTEVTLNCGEGVTLSAEPTAFYIALPPQTFTKGISLEIVTTNDSKMTKSTDNEVIIKRNHILPMAEFEYEEDKPTFKIQVVETHFNCIVVNVIPSDLEVDYVLNTMYVSKDENGAVVEENWANVVVNEMKYPYNLQFYKGKLENYVIKMNPSQYDWCGYDYYVYAFATNAEHTAPLSEPSVVTTTIDISDMPKLEWDVEASGLVWNESAQRYDLKVAPGSTVVLHFIVNNPVEGAFVALNGTSLFDNYNVVDGEPVFDNAAGTITFKIDAFDTYKKYHYVQPAFKYVNEAGDSWGIITPSLRITQVATPLFQESFANGLGEWTINNISLAEGLSYVWKHESGDYGSYAKATAFTNSANAAESMLVSPVLDLTTATMPGIQFSHAHKFATDPTVELTLWVKEVSVTEWTQVRIPTYGSNTNWTFVNAIVDLSAFAGKSVQVAFKYTSTNSAAATWEVKSVGGYDAGGVAM